MKNLLGLTGLAVAGAAITVLPARASETYRSLLFQNDLFLGRDGGGYTNGLFLSQIDAPGQGESSVAPSVLLQSIAPQLGLPDATFTATSLGQFMVTPQDIARARPDPNDVPYVGGLLLRSAQAHVHGDMTELLAFSVGVTGPAAGAARTQRIVHRIVGAQEPQGWSSQAPNKLVLGHERYRAWRFELRPESAGGAGMASAAGADVIAMGGATVGNLESSAGVGLMARYGTALERSFPLATRLSARTADPVLFGRGGFSFASLSVDRLFDYAGVGHDPDDDDRLRLRKVRVVAAVGLVFGWRDASLSVSLQKSNPIVSTRTQSQSYGSVTYTYRLR